MNNNTFNKIRKECWSVLGRKGGKKQRWQKRLLRRKVKNWIKIQDYKEQK